jgi:hypothetical protein
MDWDGTMERRQHATLTEEQLALISEWSARGVRHGVHRYARRAVIGFAILLAANIYVWRDSNTNNSDARNAIVDSGKVVSVAGCNRDYRSISALRGVLTTADRLQARAIKQGDIRVTPKQRATAHKFYTDQLNNIKLPDCRAAESILTSETGDVPPAPKPLYPPTPKK